MSGKHWLNDRTVVSVPVTPVVRHCLSKDFECHWAKGAFILITILCIFSHKVGSGLCGLLNTLRLHKIKGISLKNPIWHQGTWPTFTDLWQLKICYKEICYFLHLICKKLRNTDKWLFTEPYNIWNICQTNTKIYKYYLPTCYLLFNSFLR